MGAGAVTTAREAIVAELIGDVAGLVDRAERLVPVLTEAAEVAATRLEEAARQAAASGVEGVRQAAAAAAIERKALLADAQAVAKEVKGAAAIVRGQADRLALCALVVGAAAGGVAGAGAGFVLAKVAVG